VLHSGY